MRSETQSERDYHARQRAAEIEAGLDGAFWCLEGAEIERRLKIYNARMRELDNEIRRQGNGKESGEDI